MIPVVSGISLGARLLGFGKKYWPYIVGALVVAGLVAWAFVAHGNAVQATYDKGYAQGVLDNEKAHIAAQAKADARAQAINSKLRNENNEENRRIAGDADDLRLRGPGKARACPPPAPGAAGGHVASGGSADAVVAEVPDPQRLDLIALPFAGTVAFAEQCDANRAEVLKWRESDRQLSTPQQ